MRVAFFFWMVRRIGDFLDDLRMATDTRRNANLFLVLLRFHAPCNDPFIYYSKTLRTNTLNGNTEESNNGSVRTVQYEYSGQRSGCM